MIKVSATKIKEIEDYIKEQEMSQWELDDHIYRAYHHSYKIDYARFHALVYLYLTLYLIGKVKQIDWQHWDWYKMIKECKKHIRAPKYIKFNKKTSKYLNMRGDIQKQTLTYKIFIEMIDNKLPNSTGWIPTENHVIPYLGYFCFFKGVLECMLRWIKSDKVPVGFIDTWEGVSTYFLSHINFTNKEITEMEEYTKHKIEEENTKNNKSQDKKIKTG